MTDEVQNDAAPSSTEPAALPNDAGGASPEGTSSPAVSAPDASPSVEAEAAPMAAPAAASSLEQRLEALEGYLMKLPHSIAHAFSQGSAEPEELASRALAHLFGKN